MRLGSPGFVGSRLVEAREARRFTQTQIAELLGVQKQSVSQWEHGRQTPHPDKVDRLASVLNMPKTFFFNARRPEPERTIFYRSLSAATKGARTRGERRYWWLRDIVRYLDGFLDFPDVCFPTFDLPDDITDLTDKRIEEIATACRDFWQLGLEPIQDLMLLLENNGGICSRMSLDAHTLDSFSEWGPDQERPFFILGSDKHNAFRSRMDAAHELGHVILHRGIGIRELNTSEKFKRIEQQAFRFASALLLPEDQFCSELWAPTLDAFLALKPRWRVTVAAMIYRSKELEVIDSEYAQRLWMTLARNGWKKNGEPFDDQEPIERPRLLRRSFDMLLNSGKVSASQILASLRLNATDVEELAGLEKGRLSTERREVVQFPKLLSDYDDNNSEPADSNNVIRFTREQR